MHEDYKLGEARYFLRQMVENQADYDAVAYNLSAFLTASKSVLQYGLKEAETKLGGRKWYDAFISGSGVVKHLKDRRDFNIHEQPIKPAKSVRISFEVVYAIESFTIEKYDEKGSLIGISEDATDEDRELDTTNPAEAEESVRHQYTIRDWGGAEIELYDLAKKLLGELEVFVADGRSQGFISA